MKQRALKNSVGRQQNKNLINISDVNYQRSAVVIVMCQLHSSLVLTFNHAFLNASLSHSFGFK